MRLFAVQSELCFVCPDTPVWLEWVLVCNSGKTCAQAASKLMDPHFDLAAIAAQFAEWISPFYAAIVFRKDAKKIP
jgi:hypothetical protein